MDKALEALDDIRRWLQSAVRSSDDGRIETIRTALTQSSDREAALRALLAEAREVDAELTKVVASLKALSKSACELCCAVSHTSHDYSCSYGKEMAYEKSISALQPITSRAATLTTKIKAALDEQ